MKSFLFENILLLSQLDRRGRRVQFSPKSNLIVGRNHTGKSSLIKALYQTFGASPKGGSTEWDDRTASAVTFSVDGKKYLALRQSGYRALFTKTGELIGTASNYSEWSKIFGEAVGFNLILANRKGESISAGPDCFFLPFYINQDGSWQASWDTFSSINQFSAPIIPILEYFAGVKPPRYYEISSEKALLQKQLSEKESEHRLLQRAKERFSRSMPDRMPKIQVDNFENEVATLTEEVNKLNVEQEKLRNSLVREKEALNSIELQIKLAATALKTYDSDSIFLVKEPRELLVCPTCNAEHIESFIEVLTYAEDARVLRELVVQLRENATKLVQQTLATKAKQKELQTTYNRISNILDTRRGGLLFRDVVNSMGTENALRSFDDESATLKLEIQQKLGQLNDLEIALKELRSPVRTKEILAIFRNAYALALTKLNLHTLEMKRIKLASRPNASGSGQPRSILAYYAALWSTCLSSFGSFSIPLVIDSPNQQGQDDINLPAVLKFISDDLPLGAQVIVGTEMETPNTFDATVELTVPYKLLQEDEYTEVALVIEPMLTKMYDSLDKATR